MKCTSCVNCDEETINEKVIYCEERKRTYKKTFLARTLCSDYFMWGR